MGSATVPQNQLGVWWTSRLAEAQRKAMYANAICGWCLDVLLLCALIRFGLTFGSCLDMVLNLGAIVVLVIVRRYVFAAPGAVRARRKQSIPLGATSEYGQRVQALLAPLAGAMGLAVSDIEVVEDISDRTALPSVASADGKRHVLFLPLGFQRTIYEDPSRAQAALAHELAHVRQGDAALWGRATAFSSRAYLLLPWLGLELLVNAALLVLGAAAAYGSSHGLLPENPPPSLTEEAVRQGVKGTLASAVYFGAVLGMVFSVRSYRRTAEETADAAAVLFGDPSGDGLRRAIIACDSEYARTAGVYVSSGTQRRLAKVDELVHLASREADAEALLCVTAEGEKGPGQELSRRGAWLTGGGLVGIAAAWGILYLMRHSEGMTVHVVFLGLFGGSAALFLFGLAELTIARADPTRQNGRHGKR